MQNRKLLVIAGLVVLLAGAAAFMGGRLLNQRAGPLGLGMPAGNGDMVTISIQITPAPELPAARPDALGLFVERKDHSIVISDVSMETGSGGVAVGPGAPVDANSGPKREVVITGETILYLEDTPMEPPNPGETLAVQQSVKEGSLDDLTTQSFVSVWGRPSGDRIIAEVLLISNPVMFKRP